jgi:hypothetical protein
MHCNGNPDDIFYGKIILLLMDTQNYTFKSDVLDHLILKDVINIRLALFFVHAEHTTRFKCFSYIGLHINSNCPRSRIKFAFLY